MKEIIKINKEGGEMGKVEIIKTEVKKEFLESFLSRDDFERAEKVINTLPPEEKIQGLIKIMEYSARKVMERLEEEKWLNKIQEIANSLPESIKNQALENILKNYLKEGYVDDAEKIAKLLKRELTTEELEKLWKSIWMTVIWTVLKK
jgi:Mg/Co/Ni transporter MgtE